MIVVVHYLLAWKVYLLKPKFMVRTDNMANTFFNTQKKLSPKQARWQELLQNMILCGSTNMASTTK